VLVEQRRQAYNLFRPHSALGYMSPAPESWQPCTKASASSRQPHRADLMDDENLVKLRVSYLGQFGHCVDYSTNDFSTGC